MRLLSSLLVAALGGVIGAAPAAPILVPLPEKQPQPESDVENEPGDAPKPGQERGCVPVFGRVVLRADSERTAVSPTSGDAGESPTLDEAPALLARHLPATLLSPEPFRSTGADVCAGLLTLPPPTA